MSQRIFTFLLILLLFNLSAGLVSAKPKGTWADVRALVGQEIRVQPKTGKKVYGVLKKADENGIEIQKANKKSMSNDLVSFKRDEVKKVWRALLFDGRRKAAEGALIGAGAGAAILGGVAASQNSGETGEDVPNTILGVIVGAGVGAGLGAIAGFFVKSRHKKRDLVFQL